jgi:hypothetical protein
MPFEKQQRDHLAKQSLMKESITDALQKEIACDPMLVLQR